MKATIILTAGHSDKKSGAVYGPHREAAICTALRDAIAGALRARGYRVLTDGAAGVNLSLPEAIKLARNHSGPELELHLNAGGGTGVEAYALPGQKQFAQAIAQATARTLGLKLRGQLGWKHPRESQHGTLGICNAGAVLLEVCFIDNEQDMERLRDNWHPLTLALARVLGEWADAVAVAVPVRPAGQAARSTRATVAQADSLPVIEKQSWQVTAPPLPASSAPPAPVPAVEPAPQAASYAAEVPAAVIARTDGRKSLLAVLAGHLWALVLGVWAWLQALPPQTIFLAVLMFSIVLIALYLHRQTRLGVARESRQ